MQDVFGVVWDRSVDKDIGNVTGQVLPEPSLQNYTFPDPEIPSFLHDIPGKLESYGDRFRVFNIGFSLYERAWTMRGMEALMMDFYDHPQFVTELLNTIADYNIAQVRKALTYDIDAVYFGDDWGQQRGLQMGPRLWHKFIYPVIKRMYKEVRDAGKYVFIHSCGDVDELFDDLIDIGLNCFNPFQPEVMDVYALMKQYKGRLIVPWRAIHPAHITLRQRCRCTLRRLQGCLKPAPVAIISSRLRTPLRVMCHWKICWLLSMICMRSLDIRTVNKLTSPPDLYLRLRRLSLKEGRTWGVQKFVYSACWMSTNKEWISFPPHLGEGTRKRSI